MKYKEISYPENTISLGELSGSMIAGEDTIDSIFVNGKGYSYDSTDCFPFSCVCDKEECRFFESACGRDFITTWDRGNHEQEMANQERMKEWASKMEKVIARREGVDFFVIDELIVIIHRDSRGVTPEEDRFESIILSRKREYVDEPEDSLADNKGKYLREQHKRHGIPENQIRRRRSRRKSTVSK